MRSLLILLAVLIAAPALAAPAAGLRGPQSATATTAASAPAAVPAPAPLPPPIQSKAPLAFFAAAGQPAPQSVSECRLGCARSYYFCLSSGDSPDCPQNWTSCRATCARNSGPLP